MAYALDVQQREILGRNRLIEALMRENIEVALPLRDRGVDMLAYVDVQELATSASGSHRFVAVPVQMKSATHERFSVHKKYAKIANLLLVYVWKIDVPSEIEFYAMTYAQALQIADAQGMTKTKSWNDPNGKGKYSATRVSESLRAKLSPYQITGSRTWRHVISEAAAQGV
jgi:hypothetical protein